MTLSWYNVTKELVGRRQQTPNPVMHATFWEDFALRCVTFSSSNYSTLLVINHNVIY
jgi:hypothetical protein